MVNNDIGCVFYSEYKSVNVWKIQLFSSSEYFCDKAARGAFDIKVNIQYDLMLHFQLETFISLLSFSLDFK